VGKFNGWWMQDIHIHRVTEWIIACRAVCFYVFVYLRSVCLCFVVLCFWCISTDVLCCQYQCKWLPGKTRLQNDLLCVMWDVKLYSLTLTQGKTSTVKIEIPFMWLLYFFLKVQLQTWWYMRNNRGDMHLRAWFQVQNLCHAFRLPRPTPGSVP